VSTRTTEEGKERRLLLDWERFVSTIRLRLERTGVGSGREGKGLGLGMGMRRKEEEGRDPGGRGEWWEGVSEGPVEERVEVEGRRRGIEVRVDSSFFGFVVLGFIFRITFCSVSLGFFFLLFSCIFSCSCSPRNCI